MVSKCNSLTVAMEQKLQGMFITDAVEWLIAITDDEGNREFFFKTSTGISLFLTVYGPVKSGLERLYFIIYCKTIFV